MEVVDIVEEEEVRYIFDSRANVYFDPCRDVPSDVRLSQKSFLNDH